MQTSIYVAGPMRGYPRFNFDNFEKYTNILRSMGHLVMSPHEHDLDTGFNPDTDAPTPEMLKEMIMWDLQAVADCDAIFLLDGWEHSSGVACELALAKFLGKIVLYQKDILHWRDSRPVAYA